MDNEQKENQERIKAIVMNAPIGIAVSGPNAGISSVPMMHFVKYWVIQKTSFKK